MIKQYKYRNVFVTVLFCFALLGGTEVFAAGAAKQLAKGISLYENNKPEEAMDYFVEVLLNGNREQVAEANKYVNMIHNQVGGIQNPVEVDVNFNEGEIRTLNDTAQAATAAAQEQVAQTKQAAQDTAAQTQAQAQAARDAALAAAEAQKQEALAAVEAEQAALNTRIEAARQNALNQVAAQQQAALDQASVLTDADLEAATVSAAATEAGLPTQQQNQDIAAIDNQTVQQEQAQQSAQQPATSVFADLTSPDAVRARELYTSQKLDSMAAAAMEQINDTKGAHLYMRDGRPDAIDIDPEIIFNRGQFRPESLPLLNSVYELLALTQGAAYVILPPGSYTDDVTLAGIREAMALNSYLISRGISQGKLSYNMGLADEEPPARYANLNGLAIVFDYDAKLPTDLEKNANNETAPLLSMAVVPLCHAIDRSLGEAFAIDFSVLETVSPVDNWVLQIVQHGRDGKFYVVRQLEGFGPVYHQILWNGRKGIIGPELPCGKYTAVLTATDLKGKKQTLRRRLIVKCAEQTSCTGTCGAKKVSTSDELNYKTARLWTKPGRKMGKVATATATAGKAAQSTSTSEATKTVTTKTTILEYDDDQYDSAVAQLGVAPVEETNAYGMQETSYPTNNPYEIPDEGN